MLGDFSVDLSELDRTADAFQQARESLDAVAPEASTDSSDPRAESPRAKLTAAAAASASLLGATARGSSAAVLRLENRLRETAAAYRSVDARAAELIDKSLGEVGA